MTDQIIKYDEEMVGANHPTKADTLNRAFLIEHNSDGTHGAGVGGTGNHIYDTLTGIDTGSTSVGSTPAFTVAKFDDATDQSVALHLDIDADLIALLPSGKKLKLQLLCGRGAYTTGSLFELDLVGRKDDPDGSSNTIAKTGQMTGANLWTEDDLQWRDTGVELTDSDYGSAAGLISGQITRDAGATNNIDADLLVLRSRWVVVVA